MPKGTPKKITKPELEATTLLYISDHRIGLFDPSVDGFEGYISHTPSPVPTRLVDQIKAKALANGVALHEQ